MLGQGGGSHLSAKKANDRGKERREEGEKKV